MLILDFKKNIESIYLSIIIYIVKIFNNIQFSNRLTLLKIFYNIF